MIYILSWTTKKRQKTLSRPLNSKLKKIQGLAQKFKDFSRTFQDYANPVYKHDEKKQELMPKREGHERDTYKFNGNFKTAGLFF